MNKGVKDKWVKALRSGKYKQTYRRLHDLEGYCCLGVLCDLYIKKHKGKAGWIRNEEQEHYEIRDKDEILSRDLLTSDIKEWSGINDGNYVNIDGYGSDTLAGHNDGGRSFLEIADAIEQQL